EAPFVISGSYLDPAPDTWVHDRGGVRLTFHSEHRPLEAYMRAVEAAGLLTEAIREPRAPDHVVARDPRARRGQRLPPVLPLPALRAGCPTSVGRRPPGRARAAPPGRSRPAE